MAVNGTKIADTVAYTTVLSVQMLIAFVLWFALTTSRYSDLKNQIVHSFLYIFTEWKEAESFSISIIIRIDKSNHCSHLQLYEFSKFIENWSNAKEYFTTSSQSVLNFIHCAALIHQFILNISEGKIFRWILLLNGERSHRNKLEKKNRNRITWRAMMSTSFDARCVTNLPFFPLMWYKTIWSNLIYLCHDFVFFV